VKFTQTAIPDVLLVEPQVFRDARGFFLEVFHAGKFAESGIDARFVQDNHSLSQRGTLRGLHAQREKPQGKLIRVIEGEIFDVAVDVRLGSPTFGRHVAVMLSADDLCQLWVPPGFVHGFCVTSERAQVEYKCTALYDPGDEYGVLWNDPALAIPWPIAEPNLSEKDRRLPRLAEIRGRLPKYEA
jgi:dTDP-4-dehydrorhamnose 3,5-epimerase